MSTLPEIALSVRQPWAHAIIHFRKDIENRSWAAVRHGQMHTGRIAVHAAKGMTEWEYRHAAGLMAQVMGIECPPAHELERGGIIGQVEVLDIVRDHPSPWFFGPAGLVLRNPVARAFIPAQGALGYFKWKPGTGGPEPPARWMIKGAPPESLQGEMF